MKRLVPRVLYRFSLTLEEKKTQKRTSNSNNTFEVVGTHAVLPQGDPVLASLALPFESAGRLAAI